MVIGDSSELSAAVVPVSEPASVFVSSDEIIMGSGSSAMAPQSYEPQSRLSPLAVGAAPLRLRHSIDFIEQETKESDRERALCVDGVVVEYRDWAGVAAAWDATAREISSRAALGDKDKPLGDKALDVHAWEFDVWRLSGSEQQLTAALFVFHSHFNASLSVQMDLSAMHRLLVEVRHYMTRHDNPYHNFTHVVDVLQSCGTFLSTFAARQWFFNKDLEMFALLLSALMHDLDHPGLNNVYHANAVTHLAIRYNDVSILENYHCALAFEILHSRDFNVVPLVSLGEKKTIRKLMIPLILATDMSVHFALQAEVLSAVERVKQHSLTAAECPEKDRTLLLKSILHSADISNPAKPWAVSKQWSDLVLEEFFLQGDREKSEALPVSMNCDRDTTHQDELSLNFADFIIIPFAWAMVGWLPEYRVACRYAAENRRVWHKMLTERLQHSVQDEAALKETLGKWDARANACEEKLKALPAGN